MRLKRLRLRDIGPFSEVDLDLTTLGDVVAVAGENGAGKSTLLEAWPAAMHRRFPTRGERGGLADLATSRTSMIEAVVENGATWTLRHLVDGTSGDGDSVVLDADGRPATDSAKRKDFDVWAAAHLPSRSLFGASLFAAQGGADGFLRLDPAERKAVLLRLLGIERYERQAAAAAERASASGLHVSLKQELSGAARAAAADLVSLREAATEASANAEEIQREITAHRQKLVEARAANAAARAVNLAREAALQRRADLEIAAQEQRTIDADLTVRIANNEKMLAERAEIELGVARLAELELELAAAGQTYEAETARLSAATAQRDAAAARLEDARKREARAAVRVARLADHPLTADVPSCELELRAAKDALVEAEAESRHARTAERLLEQHAVAGATERITALRGALERVARGAPPRAAEIASAAIDADDEMSRAPSRHREQAAAASAAYEATLKSCASGRERVDKATGELAAARLASERRSERQAAEYEQAEAATDVTRERAALSEPTRLVSEADRAQFAASKRVTALGQSRTDAKAIAIRAPKLEAAEARLAELRPQQAAALALLCRLERQRDELEVPDAVDAVDEASMMTQVSALEGDVVAAQEHAATVRARRDRAEAAAVDLDRLTGELDAATATASDWTKLAQDCGRNGLQAMEIDLVGPELSERANDLLRACFSHRWTVQLETQRASANGKKTIEGCELTVSDAETGYRGPARALSGGEAVIVAEAVSLAIVTLLLDRAGMRGATLVRDESGAALSPTVAPAYVAMLRRARELAHADQVLFVSHARDTLALADATLWIENGKVTVR